MSEFRLWTRALSQREIANNQYATDPHADGLFAYFKFNEGQGTILLISPDMATRAGALHRCVGYRMFS